MARVAIATSIGPSDLLAAPPAVFTAMVDLLEEQSRADERERLRQKHKERWGL